MPKTLMDKLFADITQGLALRKWRIRGGNDTGFLILSKGGNTIKVFADNYTKPNYFVVRFSARKDGKL